MPKTPKQTRKSLLKNAYEYLNNNQFKNAAQNCEALLTLDPNHAEAIYIMGIIQHQQGHRDHAIHLMQQAIKLEPNNVEFSVNLGNIFQNLGQERKAISIYKKVLNENHTHLDLLKSLGVAYYSLKWYKPAAKAFQQIIDHDPSNAEAYNNLGVMLHQQRKLSTAAISFNKAIELAPKHYIAYTNLSNLLTDKKKYTDAIKCAEKSIALNSQYVEAYDQLAAIYDCLDMPNKTKTYYRKALAQQPNHYKTLVNYARFCHQQQKSDQAFKLLDKAISLEPDNVVAYSLLGLIYCENKQITKAIEAYSKVITLAPKDDNAQLCLVNIYMAQKKYEKAHPLLEKLIAKQPNNKKNHLLLASVYQHLGHKKDAVTHYKLAKSSKNPYPELLMKNIAKNRVSHLPRKHVMALFDNYANRFERHLQKELHYYAPMKLLKLLKTSKKSSLQFNKVLDLGCGTGLVGELMAPFSKYLVGIDLAKKMLKEAKKKKVYNELVQSDMVDFIKQSQQCFDLVIAADVFIYVGKLEPFFQNLHRIMKANSLLMFSTESIADKDDYCLQTSGRFAHSSRYIKKLSKAYDFKITAQQSINLRKEYNLWLPGELFILEFHP